MSLKKKGITTAINFTPERGWINDELVLSISAKEKITFKSMSIYLLKTIIKSNNKKYSFIYNYDGMNEYSILERYLFEKNIPLNSSKIVFNISDSNIKKLELISDKKFICIAPFASNLGKAWGMDNYRNLIEYLSQK